MSLSGGGTEQFAPLSGEETIDLGQFNDIVVNGKIYLKEATDTYTGYNAPLITTDKSNDDMIFNTTTLSSNWDFTVGTGQDTKESILKINPTTGLSFEAGGNPVNIDWNELSYLNGARSNIQTQIDNLDPDLSSNQGYWGNFWENNTITNPTANTVIIVPFGTTDPNNYGITVGSGNRITVAHEGIYMFIATIQIQKGAGGSSADSDVFFWIRQNGVDVPDTAFRETIRKVPQLITCNWQLKMQATDYLQLAWSSPDIHIELLYLPASGTPTKPAIPSVILTASQVSFLVAGGSGLLPLIYNTASNRVICDASFQVLGNTDLSGNTLQRGNLDISGNTLATGASFVYSRNVADITVQNALWIDGSGAVPTFNNPTTMFSNVKNQTLTLHGWTWSGTATGAINGFGGIWVGFGSLQFNTYGNPPPNSGNYWVFFEAYSSGSTASASTFFYQKELTLDAGFYVAEWYSYWGAGTQYATTSLSVSVGAGASLLTYNDSDTRSSLIWKPRSLLFEVKTSGSNPLRWTFRDSQATSNRYFNASVANLRIKKYTGITASDPSNNSLVAGSLCNLNNANLVGTNSITGTLQMSGIPTIFSSKGVNNICLSTAFTSAALGASNAQNIAIGSVALYAESFTDCVLIAQNAMTDVSQQQKTATQSIAIGNEIRGSATRDVLIGHAVRKSFNTLYTDCTMIGWGIGTNATATIPLNRCTALGSSIWRGGFYGGTATPPVDNVAIGYNVQNRNSSGFWGSFCTAVGAFSQTWLQGNATTASYNTSIGYYSGVDPAGDVGGGEPFRENYMYGTYLGAYARSKGNVVGVKYATAVGYQASADASFCTVIGADASYNVQNTIRLGRPQDTTVASILNVLGASTLTGNTTVGNLSITGTLTGVSSFPSLSITGNLSVGGEVDISGNLTLAATANIVSSTLDARFSGVSSSISAVDTKATNAQNRADDAYDLASTAQSTAAAAAGVAAGAAAGVITNAAAIAATSATVAGLSATVGTQGTAISTLETSMATQQSKTQYMLPVSAVLSTSKFFNNISIYETELSVANSIYLSPTTTSTFAQGVECKTISTLAGNVQNIRGSTVNIADSGGATNIDCSSVSIGNVAGSTVQIGQSTSTLTANVGTVNLGNTSASNVQIGASNSNITIGGLTSAIYINGFLYIPFNPASFVSALAQWT